MAQAKGSNAYLAFQKETTFATDPGTPDLKKLPFTTESLSRSIALEVDATIRGSRNPVSPVRGNQDMGGQINVNLGAYPGNLFLGLLGAVQTETTWASTTAYTAGKLVRPTAENGYFYRATVAGTSGGSAPSWPTTVGNTVVDGTVTWRCEGTKAATAHTHLFTVGSSLPSYTIEKGYADIAQFIRYSGCKVGGFSLSATPSGAQQASFTILGAKAAASGTSFDATLTDLGITNFDGFRVAAGAILEGGTAVTGVSALSISVDNGLDGDTYYIGGQGQRAAINEGIVAVRGSLRGVFQDLTIYNKAVNQTPTSLKIIFAFGAGTGAAGAESIEFYLPEVLFSLADPPVDGPKGIMASFDFQAYVSASVEATALQILLKNTQDNASITG